MKKCFLIIYIIVFTNITQTSLKNLAAKQMVKTFETYNINHIISLFREEWQQPIEIMLPVLIQLIIESDQFTVQEKRNIINAFQDRTKIAQKKEPSMPTYDIQMLKYLDDWIFKKIEDQNVHFKGIDVSIFQKNGDSILHAIIRKNDNNGIALLDWIISFLSNPQSINWNTINLIQETPLHIAAGKENVMNAIYLINHGSKRTKLDIKGQTPLCKLLAQGVNLGIVLPKPEDFPTKQMFKDAKAQKQTERIQAIIELEGLPFKNDAIIPLLISDKEGTDNAINIPDNTGKTPLHYAAMYHNVNIVELLMLHGADINAQDNNGDTSLHMAAEKGRAYNMHMLIVKGHADFHILNKTGQIALDKIDLIIGQIKALANQKTFAHYLSAQNFLKRIQEEAVTTNFNFYWLPPDAFLK